MTDLAGGLEAAGHVVRIVGVLEVRLVAGVAAGRRAGVAGAVALEAAGRGVRAGQREVRGVVVEGRGLPGLGVVAEHALGVEAGGRVIRVRGAVVVALMAADAGGGLAAEAPLVAGRAVQRGVRAVEREEGVVVEVAVAPARRHRGVAVQAVGGHARLLVVGIRRRLVVGGVAGEAVAGRAREGLALGPAVTGLAVHTRVDAHQREAAGGMEGQGTVIGLPVVRRVAGRAVEAQLAGVDVGVAVRAGRRHAPEAQVAVAAVAVGSRVRPLEGVARGLVVEAAPGDVVPVLRPVTLGAVGLERPVRAGHLGLLAGAEQRHQQDRRQEQRHDREHCASADAEGASRGHGVSPCGAVTSVGWQDLQSVGSGR